MADVSPEAKAYLYELYTRTGTDLDVQVSMYDVGQSLGMEKNDAGSMAESLYIQGLAELKTLSGGIGITREGLAVLEIKPAAGPDSSLSLGNGPVLDGSGREALDCIIPEIKKNLAEARIDYPGIEEILLDIKTIEVQMLSPKPKTAIIREVLRSIQSGFESLGSRGLAAKLKALAAS